MSKSTHSVLPPIPAQLTTTSDRLFNLAEVAEYLRVSPRTVASFIRDPDRPNKLVASWVGRAWVVTQKSLNDFLAANQRDKSQPRKKL